jgi:hypothetical protein
VWHRHRSNLLDDPRELERPRPVRADEAERASVVPAASLDA